MKRLIAITLPVALAGCAVSPDDGASTVGEADNAESGAATAHSAARERTASQSATPAAPSRPKREDAEYYSGPAQVPAGSVETEKN
jgi:hypothetical protein